jgi:hypothetical protein
MSALGQKRTFAVHSAMSAKCQYGHYVPRYVRCFEAAQSGLKFMASTMLRHLKMEAQQDLLSDADMLSRREQLQVIANAIP